MNLKERYIEMYDELSDEDRKAIAKDPKKASDFMKEVVNSASGEADYLYDFMKERDL